MTPPRGTAFRRALPAEAAELVSAVVRAADEARVAVYAVGGPVRDWLLGRALRDVDLVVEGGEPAKLAESVAGPDVAVSRHDRFGTVQLRGPDVVVDLAAARRERYPAPGGLPSVEPGAAVEDDLERRDFTVNSLAVPVSRRARSRHPGIVDPGDGLRDLERRVLRVHHARSFHDDPTRALRAARLAARLGFSLTRGSRAALRDALRDGTFGGVSGDRLRRELVRVFDEAQIGTDAVGALRLLSDWHVLGALEPGLELHRQAVLPLRRIRRAAERPPWRAGRWRIWVSALEVWLAPLPPALRRRSLRRFAVRGELADRIASFPRRREGWLRSLATARGRGAVDALLAPLAEEELHALYACAPPAGRRRIVRFAAEDRARRTPVGGEDLVEIGLRGPVVGRALARIRAAYLDGSVRGRDEAIALARELVSPRGRRAGRRAGPRRLPRHR